MTMEEIKRTPAEIVAMLETNPPQAFAKITMPTKNKAGEVKDRYYIMDLCTGDVFKNRRLEFGEFPHHPVVRRHSEYNRGEKIVEEVVHFGFVKPYVLDEGIVLAKWIYADYSNEPDTSHINAPWYGGVGVTNAIEGEIKNPSAIKNFVLATPKIAALLLVDKDKEIYTWEDVERYGMEAPSYQSRLPHNRHLCVDLYNSVTNASCIKDVVGLLECFKEFFKIGYVGANQYVTFDYAQDISCFMRTKKTKEKTGPKQKTINELCAITMPDHSNEEISEIDCENFSICYADRVNDEWTALRWYRPINGERVETTRMFVNKTNALLCRTELNMPGQWFYVSAKLKAETFKASKVVMQSDDVFDGTKLEYFKNIITDVENQSAALYMLTLYPEFEKMYKMDLGWLCDSYLGAVYQGGWHGHVERYCGNVDWKAKTIFKMLGVNRHQITTINQYIKHMHRLKLENWEKYYTNSIISELKRIFNVNELNTIDDNTFDYIVSTMKRKSRLGHYYTGALERTYNLFGNNAIYYIKDLNAVSDGTQVVMINRHGTAQATSADMVYSDLIRMVSYANYSEHIKPRFSSLDELVSHHDTMVDLINTDNDAHGRYSHAQYMDSFNRNKAKWLDFEYDEDDTFCVIAPKAPVDLAVEGIELHHCVKSFIPAVALGETNIVFIRKKGNEEVPFFTVEIDTRNSIRQAHGNCNCNVDTVAGLKEFITKWAKAKKLKYVSNSANRIAGAGY